MAHQTGRMSGSPDTCWLPQARLHCPSTFLFCLQSLHLLTGASPLLPTLWGPSPQVPVNTEVPLPLSTYSSSPHCPCLGGGHDSGWTESPFLDKETEKGADATRGLWGLIGWRRALSLPNQVLYRPRGPGEQREGARPEVKTKKPAES